MKMDTVPSVDIAELATSYDDKRRMDPVGFERLRGWIFHYGKVPGRVLEIGCGTGFYLVPLAKHLPGAHCYGIDITEAMLAQAKAKAKEKDSGNCLLAKADAHYLPFKEDCFNFVLMFQVLHYFQDMRRVAADVHRVSKQGARLLVITTRDVARVPSLEEIRHLFEEHGILYVKLGKGGLEPPRLSTPDPKSGPSANSGTSPFRYEANTNAR